jgi:hypothetical protein
MGVSSNLMVELVEHCPFNHGIIFLITKQNQEAIKFI